MRKVMVCFAMVAACGGADEMLPDAAIDGPPRPTDATPADPFVGLYDSLDDFPADGCVPGSMAGFAQVDLWPSLWTRTEVTDGALHIFQSDFIDDVEVPYQLDPDGLLIRRTFLDRSPRLESLRICALGPDHTLIGHSVYCSYFNEQPHCTVTVEVAHPYRRGPGEGDGDHLTLLGELAGNPRWPGVTANVRVDGDLAYLAREADGLRIVDLSDPAHPIERGHFVVAGEDYYNDVKLLRDGTRRYVIAASSPVRIIDVTNPEAPTLAANVSVSAHTVFVDGTTAYFATGGFGAVTAYDLSHPRTPRYLGGYDGGFAVHDLYVEDGIAYLSATDEGMIVVDLIDPAHPHELGREDLTGQDFRYWHSPWVTRIGGRRVIVHGDEGAPTGLRLLDGEPTSLTFLQPLGEWASRPDISIHNVMAFGERAYVAHYRDGVRIFDLHDPSAPSVIGYFNTWILGTPVASGWSGAFGVDVDLARRRVYVAEAQRGLMILQGDALAFP